MDVRARDTLASVPASDWDALLRPGQGTLSHAFLSPCDRTLAEGAWRIFTIESPALVAAAPGLIHSVDLADLAPGAMRAAFAAARRLSPRAFRPRVLELGPPCCPGAPLLAREPADLETIAGALLDAAWRDVASEERADALVVRDLAGPGGGPVEKLLEARGFALMSERVDLVARVHGASLEEHLATMRAAYRRRALRYLALDLDVRVTASFGERADEIARLVAITAAHAGGSRHERVDAAVVEGWALSALARAVLVSRGGHLLLVAIVLVDPPVLRFIRTGFEREVARETGAYMRLLYELVRLAAAERCEHIDLGFTSADPKLRAGARAVPLRVWVRHRSPVVHALVRRASPVLARPEEIPARRVFRAPPVEPVVSWYQR